MNDKIVYVHCKQFILSEFFSLLLVSDYSIILLQCAGKGTSDLILSKLV